MFSMFSASGNKACERFAAAIVEKNDARYILDNLDTATKLVQKKVKSYGRNRQYVSTLGDKVTGMGEAFDTECRWAIRHRIEWLATEKNNATPAPTFKI